MNVYCFAGTYYCEKCAKSHMARLIAEGNAPANLADERTFNSLDFPKGPVEMGSSDIPEHCGSGPSCLESTIIDGVNCGCFLENDLTSKGIEYILDLLKEEPDSSVGLFWADYYSKHGYEFKMINNLWIRAGDGDGYNEFGTNLHAAAQYLIEMGVDSRLEQSNIYSVECEGLKGCNHISIYWGGVKADTVPIRGLIPVELQKLNNLIDQLK